MSKQTEQPEQKNQSPRMCFYVPVDAFVEEHGFRVSIVKEGVAGHFPTGDWPYEGRVDQRMPYFWGPSYDDACKIVASSISAQNKGGRRSRRRS